MLEIAQVSVGTPALLGKRRGKEVISSIKKEGVWSRFVTLTPEGIEGDEQADTRVIRGKRVHGGLLQAVYAYPLSHLGHWAEALNINCPPATLGENLTVVDATGHDIRIDDVFMWGDARLRVTKPRRPCYKLNMHLSTPEAAELMNRTGWCGWYFAVIVPGEAPTDGHLELVASNPEAPTVAEVFAAKVRADPTIPDMPDE